jgi:CheY-like chemotaxis protein
MTEGTGAISPLDILRGRKILIVEDEPFIALTLEDMLTDLGCMIAGSVSQVADALALIREGGIDAAVLDVNLGAQKIDPVANELAGMGCPFIFTTGYGREGVPPSHNQRGIVAKPFTSDDLALALSQEISGRPA